MCIYHYLFGFVFGLLCLPPLYLIYGLKPYIFSLDGSLLFSKGERLDFKISFYYKWIFVFGIYKFIPDYFTVILILDQISRHIYRYNPDLITKYTLVSEKYIHNVIDTQYHNLSIKEKAFLSLATRHLLRIISQSSDYNGSDRHLKISESLDVQIQLLDLALQEYQTFNSRLATSGCVDQHLETYFLVKKINSHNLKIYRCHRYIKTDYQVWNVKPNYSPDWYIDFVDTKISKYFQSRLVKTEKELFSDKNKINIVLMISGGIDSMTMARIVFGILHSKSKRFEKFNFHGLHINWQKRNEATLEADALEMFFKKYNALLEKDNQFSFQVIDSTVDPNNSDWDNKSTQFRIKTLQFLDRTMGDESTVNLFTMGHVVEDLIENLICNSTMEGVTTGKQTYLDLFGMRELVKRKIYFFRPLLLHGKPKNDDTPHFLDNAKNLDVKRRVIRRAIKEYSYDLSRIKQVYSEFMEINGKYPYSNCIQDLENDDDEFYVIPLDLNWTSTELRMVLNNFMNSLGYPNLKRNSISHLVQKIKYNLKHKSKNQFKVNMSKPFLNENSFKVNLDNKQILIPNLKIV